MSSHQPMPSEAGESEAGESCEVGAAERGPRPYEAPRNEVELGVAEILAGLLGRDRIGRNDNFILLGGESLRAAQAARQIWDRFGREVSLRSILVGKVSDIAAALAAAVAEKPPS